VSFKTGFKVSLIGLSYQRETLWSTKFRGSAPLFKKHPEKDYPALLCGIVLTILQNHAEWSKMF
jgi:hypothetical protein